MKPLKKLIIQSTRELNLSRCDLAKAIGYTNTSKGLRRIDNYVDALIDLDNIKEQLQCALDIDSDEMELAVSQRQQQLNAEHRRLFKPSLQTIVSSTPSPIFVAALVPKLWNIPIKSDLKLLTYQHC